MTTAAELFAAMRAVASGDSRPVVLGEDVTTTDDLFAAAAAVAGEVTGAPGLAVHATVSAPTVAAVLGGLAAGVPVIPVPADTGVAERDHIVADSGASVLYAERADDPALAGLPIPVRTVGRLGRGRPAGRGRAQDAERTVDPARASRSIPVPTVGGPDRDLGRDAERGVSPTTDEDRSRRTPAPAGSSAPAMVLYTSGTTGKPKGVTLSADAIRAGLEALFDRWRITGDDTVAHGLPLYHVHGLILGVLGPLWAGAGLHHTGRPTPERYAAARAAGATTFFGVPTVWSRVTQDATAAATLAGARLLVSGSAALPPTVFEALTARTGCPVIERYGMTETLITVSTALDRPRRPGTVGWPIDGVATRLVTDRGEPMAPGDPEPGDLQVRGATLFDGYLHLPAVTAESFTADGWFRTGDVATIDADGCHRIVGRASVDLIKSGGFRIGAGEIEDCLRTHPSVLDCAVVGMPDDDLGQRIEAFVIGTPVPAGELIDHVAHHLSVHKRPRRVHFVTELPRNHMGKVQKTVLLAGG